MQKNKRADFHPPLLTGYIYVVYLKTSKRENLIYDIILRVKG